MRVKLRMVLAVVLGYLYTSLFLWLYYELP